MFIKAIRIAKLVSKTEVKERISCQNHHQIVLDVERGNSGQENSLVITQSEKLFPMLLTKMKEKTKMSYRDQK